MRASGIEPFIVDVSTLEATPYSLSDRVLCLETGGGPKEVTLEARTRGWIRRLAPPHWRRGTRLGSEASAIRASWMALLASIAGDPEVTWLTPLDRLFLRENKLLQARVANRLGVPTPSTVVVSHREAIPSELGDRLIVKPLGPASFTASDGAEQVVWTHEITRESPVLDRLAGAPFIVQRYLQAERHLRVVTVQDAAWTCELAGAACRSTGAGRRSRIPRSWQPRSPESRRPRCG